MARHPPLRCRYPLLRWLRHSPPAYGTLLWRFRHVFHLQTVPSSLSLPLAYFFFLFYSFILLSPLLTFSSSQNPRREYFALFKFDQTRPIFEDYRVTYFQSLASRLTPFLDAPTNTAL